MKKLFFALMAIITLTSCGGRQKSSTQNSAEESTKEGIEVIYFHGKQRCVTCNAIENLTKEVLDKEFTEQLKKGDVRFRIVDISTGEGETIADKYEVTWSSLYINQWKDGKENKNNMTDFGFSYATASPDEFKEGVKKKIEELLK